MKSLDILGRQSRSPNFLSSFLGGRDNNLNSIRLLAACAVIVSHAFYLVEAAEPGQDRLGHSLGGLALDVFFVVSGLLVTRSLALRQSGLDFVCARTLRIFPGLAVHLLFVAFVLGPVLSTLPFFDYVSQLQPFVYVVKNLQLLAPPMPYVVLPGLTFSNGSLWSLPVEVCCYLVLLSGWLVGSRIRYPKAANALVIVFASLVLCLSVYRFSLTAGFHLAWMFASGVACYLLRAKLVLSRPMALLACAALIASSFDRRAFNFCVLFAGPYLVLYCAFVPAGWYRMVNKFGDYSYGIYIYGFPAQYVVLRAFPNAGVLLHIALAVPLAAVAGALSWHFVEKPALGKVREVTGGLRKLLAARIDLNHAATAQGKENQP